MKRRTDQPELPNFHLISRAFEMARKVMSRSSEALRVGIVDRTGTLTAEGVLRGYSQASVFADLLRRIGYQELLPRTAQRTCECHVAFMAPNSLPEATLQPNLPQAVLDTDVWPGVGSATFSHRSKVADPVE